MSTLFSIQRVACSFVLWLLKPSPIVPSIANQAHTCPDLGIIVDLVNGRIRTCYRQQREHSVWIGTAFNFTAQIHVPSSFKVLKGDFRQPELCI